MSSRRPPSRPLESRHVFLDTQVYRALGHNPQNPALIALSDHVSAHRVVLHTTDITLLEVKRHILEAVQTRSRQVGAVEKDLRRWRKQAPKSTPKQAFEFDANTISNELFEKFHSFLRHECGAIIHNALGTVDINAVFRKYFSREAPFDHDGSKEFPDAFVIDALSRWATNSDKIHVVTGDSAMGRAANADPNLLPVKDIHEILSRAVVELEPDADDIAERLLNSPAFDKTFENLLQAQIQLAAFNYTGDLIEGEAFEGRLVQIEEVGSWSVLGLSERRVSLILEASIRVQVEVQYEDRDSAYYDREDDVWIGTEDATMHMEDEAAIKILVEIDRNSGEVITGELLTQEIDVCGPHHDWPF